MAGKQEAFRMKNWCGLGAIGAAGLKEVQRLRLKDRFIPLRWLGRRVGFFPAFEGVSEGTVPDESTATLCGQDSVLAHACGWIHRQRSPAEAPIHPLRTQKKDLFK